MRKRAFTLIETLVALGIIVIVLGASVTANRVLLSSSQGAEDKVQMEAIADEGTQLMQLLERQEAAHAGSISNYMDLADSNPQWIMPLASKNISLGSPNNFTWCTHYYYLHGYANNNQVNLCEEADSVVQLCKGGGAQTMMDIVTSTGGNLTGGEIIGVRRTSIRQDPNTLWKQIYYSFTNRRGTAAETPIWAPDLTGATCPQSTPGVDFYVRSIEIQRDPTATWFSTLDVTKRPKVSNKIYRVTLKVSKYLDSSITPITRSFTLSDYYTP